MNDKRVYLIGGLGNNLFQLDKALDVENTTLITNLIEDSWYSKLFGWTFHSEAISSIEFQNNVCFKRLPTIQVLTHLILLFFALKLERPVRGVSWEAQRLTRINFGYWQKKHLRNHPVRIRIKTPLLVDVKHPVIHVRLGDSPTIQEDLESQLVLISKNVFDKVIFVTNDKSNLSRLLHEETEINYEIMQNSVLQDLYVMLSAETLVIPRSTFSLLAAALSKNLSKLYVAEDFWNEKGFNLPNVDIKYY